MEFTSSLDDSSPGDGGRIDPDWKQKQNIFDWSGYKITSGTSLVTLMCVVEDKVPLNTGLCVLNLIVMKTPLP